jgi:hypothetical protein
LDTNELSLRVSHWTDSLLAVLRKDGSCGGVDAKHRYNAVTEPRNLRISPFMLLVVLVAPFVLQRVMTILKEV